MDTPVSLYAATKRADELMSHAYAHLYRPAADRAAVLHRLWAVGPAGHGVLQLRPGDRGGRADHAVRGRRAAAGFTYVDDIVAGVVGLPGPAARGTLPARVLNIGNHRSEEVSTLVGLLEQALGPAGDRARGAAAGGGCGGDIRLGGCDRRR